MTQTESPGGAPSQGGRAYRAFISYSHRDKQHAAWLHRTVEAYRIPKKLVGKETPIGPAPARPSPIFRDRDELPASADLGGELMSALQRSMFLIVICSRASAKSHWVMQEILSFKRMHGESRVLALIVDGTPYASNTPGQEDEECFPLSLRFKLGPDGQLSDVPAEPIAADMRPEGDGKRLAQMKLIAGLTGLRLDELVQREAQRRNQRLMMVASGAMAGMVVTGGLAVYANFQRIEADRQRLIAEKESAAARAASDYLVGTFELSNPATENPRTITALTILGRSAERARTELANQPEIQVRLLATLGRAYNNLGLLGEAKTAVESSLPAIRKAGPDGAEALLVLSATYVRQGALDKAAATVKQAVALLGPDPEDHPELRAQAALTEGRIATSRSDVKAGVAAFDRALAFYRVAPDASPRDMAVAYNNRGLLLSDDGQFDQAEASLKQSLAIFRRASGENHLLTGRAWFALAQNSFNAGKLEGAESEIAQALKIQRVVLDGDNPLLADTLSMQGQILQGRGKLAEAERALREAVSIYRKAFEGQPHYLIGIADVYLALIESETGRTEAALATLADAKRNYDGSYGEIHPNHGDLLVNRAKVLARAGRMGEARVDCAAGIDILRKTLGANASFTRQMAAECGALGTSRQARL
ncbi:MAG: toll/interleukin-1 receptor domain-containing protein [Phenylobacterium sp.]|uniref:toll/interleukin-1 receptor domain-containing protein n=1 Tax=Phenylobacterium sp. TaxID=1871053 RepID=UPI001A557487|nr:toll/interleukin-1 receptor domain-containing protein [Phenylobacterium sp.]MBL8772315.1 toll/interleukin-1 receptor domain-containing protein [Phenylobacterium sp.]